MYPDLFSIGPVHIKTYGLMLAISFFFGVWLAIKRAEKNGISSQDMIDLSFIVILSAIIGSRFFYVAYHTEEFAGHWLDAVNPFQSSGVIGIAGLSMMGGIVLAIAAAMVYFIIRKMSPWAMLDSLAPAFFVGLAITRIGCFFNGCCYGMQTDHWCGVTFPFHHHAVWPTQLFSSAAGFIMLGALLLIEKKWKVFHGFTFWIALMMYSLWRFLIDFIRYYEETMVIVQIGGFHITRNQFLTICLFIIAVFWFIFLKRHHVETSEQSDK